MTYVVLVRMVGVTLRTGSYGRLLVRSGLRPGRSHAGLAAAFEYRRQQMWTRHPIPRSRLVRVRGCFTCSRSWRGTPATVVAISIRWSEQCSVSRYRAGGQHGPARALSSACVFSGRTRDLHGGAGRGNHQPTVVGAEHFVVDVTPTTTRAPSPRAAAFRRWPRCGRASAPPHSPGCGRRTCYAGPRQDP